jgi:streptogramin lyase
MSGGATRRRLGRAAAPALLAACLWPAPAAALRGVEEVPVETPAFAVAIGPDRHVWFTDLLGTRLGRIRPDGTGLVHFTPPTAGVLRGLTAGPDGNLWYAGSGSHRIGRVTPAGAITEFPVPTAGANPYDIAAGPDGNLWFTEYTANKIGRITPAGAITEFPIPTAASGAQGITAGPDGNLWFTQTTANKIGRITPAGTVTEFPVTTAASQPLDITAGPDGNLWFTEYAAAKIGRITPGGVVTEFSVFPSAFVPGPSAPRGIVTGPDGLLWFVEETGRRLTAMTTTGVVVARLPVHGALATPAYVARGAGGLWASDLNRSVLLRVRLGGVPGDVDGDRAAELVTAPGAGGGPHVRVTSARLGFLQNLFPYPLWFAGGVRVASCDVDGDGAADVVTAPGPTGGPHVRVLSGATGQPLLESLAYVPIFTGGVFVACADVDGDGVPDVVTGAGEGGGPHLRVLSGVDGAPVREVFPFAPGFVGGVRVGP